MGVRGAAMRVSPTTIRTWRREPAPTASKAARRAFVPARSEPPTSAVWTSSAVACCSAGHALPPLERGTSRAAPEPRLRLGCLPEVEAGEKRPAQHRGDVQIRHGEAVADQVLFPGECAIQDPERCLETL